VPSGQSLVSTVRVLFGLMVVAAVAVGRTMSIVVVGVGGGGGVLLPVGGGGGGGGGARGAWYVGSVGGLGNG
jgi:hypothetical protein